MSLEEQFQKSANDVKKLKSKPTDQELLDIYGLFKQATAGDNTSTKPGMFDLKGKAKWEAWTTRKGMSKDEAKSAYVARVKQLIDTYGLNS